MKVSPRAIVCIVSVLLIAVLLRYGPRFMMHWSNSLPAEVTAALREADKGTLYSIKHRELDDDDKEIDAIAAKSKGLPTPVPEPTPELLDEYEILGKVELDKAKLNIVANEFRSALDHWNGTENACFNPRHALRIESGGHVYDLVLCYECKQLEIYEDGAEIRGDWGAGGSPAVLNKILTDAKVPLAP
jgi:hypothetical protein